MKRKNDSAENMHGNYTKGKKGLITTKQCDNQNITKARNYENKAIIYHDKYDAPI